ncbi:MAG TPA: serine hydrolase [Acidimicrobiales bacterium]|nr:serine hydrolase [Acidimicrobiales bacterium]
MSRAVAVVFAALALVLVGVGAASGVAAAPAAPAAPVRQAQTQPPASPPPAPPPPRAWALVDADTGAVLDGGRDREPQLVASVFKVLTAVAIVENLEAEADVTVSSRAEGMPARKINLKAGQVWQADDLLYALLLVSANDAAVALAERTAGTLEAFGGMLDATAARLGMADRPVLRDPAGLDDEFSVDGGNRISARDLAIATRAFLAYPELTAIVSAPDYRFAGGDGNPHRLLNHNRLLKTYPGAVGIKTGYTKKAGHSLIAAARRDGRTMIAVVIGAADPYGSAVGLLDKGFATPVQTQGEFDRLPEVRLGTAADPVTHAPPLARPVSTPTGGGRSTGGVVFPVALLVVGATPALVILSRRSRQRRSGEAALWRA